MTTTVELVNHPSHYKVCSGKTRHIVELLGVPRDYLDLECIEVIETFYEIRSNYHIGESLTHLWRYGKKKGEEERDLQKALWYLMRLVEKFPNGKDRDRNFKAAALVGQLIHTEFPNGY